jgi:hypothetical protein
MQTVSLSPLTTRTWPGPNHHGVVFLTDYPVFSAEDVAKPASRAAVGVEEEVGVELGLFLFFHFDLF